MASSEAAAQSDGALSSLPERYQQIRSVTVSLCQHLEPEDCVVQSMPDVSPTKWHLAHVTWLFEHFVLEPHLRGYERFNEQFHYLFNSYYYSVGQMHPRPERGLLSRPTLKEIIDYRAHVDDAVQELLATRSHEAAIEQLIILGLNHEQQHQELLLTDIKHVFSCNPLKPAVNPSLSAPPAGTAQEHTFIEGVAGIREIGAAGNGFCFDNETPRHRELLHEHSIGSRLVNNGEYLGFIRDGGYTNSGLWLSDGWATINERGWSRPLYWSKDYSSDFTLGGERDLDPDAPVSHVSYYEADAYARWPVRGCRRKRSGRSPRQHVRLKETFWNRITGNRLLLPTDARSFSVMCGNGPRRRIRPTPASTRWPVHSVSTTASSCVTR